MATISENLQTLKTSVSAIKQAISDKGGDVSGDISTWAVSIENMEGGGSSSGGAYSEVNHGTSDTTFTLTPNTFHVWDEVSSLTLTLDSERSGVANEFLFQFTSGATATTLILPDDIKWANDSPPTIAENMIYQISILKGLASVLEFKSEMISFSVDGTPYQAPKDVTWQDFCDSEYNTYGFSISFPYVMTPQNKSLYANGGVTDVIFNHVIQSIDYTVYHSGGGGGE